MDNSENHRFNESESESNSNSMYTSESERNNNERHSESLTQSQQQHQHTSDEHNSKIRQDEDQDARLMSMLIYLLGLFTSFIAPLVIWLVKRKDSKLVDTAGKTYLNYFISYFIYLSLISFYLV